MDVDKRELRVALARTEAPVAFELRSSARRRAAPFRLANISRTGMFVETTETTDKGAPVAGASMHFALRFGREEDEVTGVAMVRWVRSKAAGPYLPQGVGIQVIEFHENAERRYLEFLESCLLQLRVTDLMDPSFVSVGPDVSTGDTLARMRAANAGCAIVASGSRTLGVFSLNDLLAATATSDFEMRPVQELMTKQPAILTTDQETDVAYELMRQGSVQHVPVAEDGIVVGVLSTRELIRYWSEYMDLQTRRLARSYDRATSVIAHDLRTPIGLIQTTSQMLTSGEMSPEEFATSGLPETIEQSCDMMMGLIDDILDVGKIRAGAVRLDFRTVDVEELLARVARAFGPAAQSKAITLRVDVHGVLPRIKADPLRLEQVLNNLVSNALKFTPEGGKVELGARPDHSRIAVWVRDTGAGIPAHETAARFKDYARASTRPTRGEKSTGLGLAICKRLVEAHGGAIAVESRVGAGSVFTVSLPIGDIQ
jgi:signal transduction histidine kinase